MVQEKTPGPAPWHSAVALWTHTQARVVSQCREKTKKQRSVWFVIKEELMDIELKRCKGIVENEQNVK